MWVHAYTPDEINENRYELGAATSSYLKAHYKCTNEVVLTNSMATNHGTLINFDLSDCWKPNYAGVWNGSESSDFNNKNNWEEGLIPDPVGSGSLEANQFVIVKPVTSGANSLVIDEIIEVNSIVFNDLNNTSLTSDGHLKVLENLYSFGSITNSGSVTFKGTIDQHIYGENNFNNLIK